MNILIPVFSPATGTWGGLTRMIAIAQAAEQAGHRVAFCASGELFLTLQKRGYTVYPTPPSTLLGLPKPISRVLAKRTQQNTLPVRPGRDFGNIWFVLLLLGAGRSSYLNRLVEAERRAAQDFQADFVFTDLDPGAYLLARINGLPIATAYQTPMAHGVGSFPWKLLNRSTNTVLKTYQISPQPVDQLFYGPQVLKIIPSIPDLEGTDPNQPDVRYVGQLLGDIQAGKAFTPEPGKRYIFVYIGTGAVSLTSARIVLPQVFQADGKYVCLVGSQSVTSVERIGGVEFHPYVPAAEVLPHCDWTICHGGQNTIIQSLINGVPLLIFPGPIFERRFNARQIQQEGAGRMGELNDFTVEWITRAMEDQSACALKAAQLGERIRSYGGAKAVVEELEDWTHGEMHKVKSPSYH